MKNEIKKIPVISIVLYGITGVLVLYTIWALNHSVRYISQMVDMGQLTFKGNEYDIINFYMSGSAQYALFAIVLFTLGWILQKNSFTGAVKPESESKEALSSDESENNGEIEEGFEDWFQNNDK